MPSSDAADEQVDPRVEQATDELYALPSEQFTDRRAELAKAARADDAAAAKRIGALRKPTLAASVVNRLVHHDRDVTQRIGALGDRLRRAHRDLDAAAMRELTGERRALVSELTTAAFAHAERADPPIGLRDEVAATFDAALADPDIATRLGRLTRAEQFSGFGLAAGPELTLVTGGKSEGRTSEKKNARSERTPREKPAGTDATTRRLRRAADKARVEFEAADDRLRTADSAEQQARTRVDSLTGELADLQRELDDAKHDLDRARKDARTAQSARRQARSALDRAERGLAGSE